MLRLTCGKLYIPSSQREKCPYSGFSGPYFPSFELNREIYAPNAGKYGPEKLQYAHFLCGGSFVLLVQALFLFA